jgi:membrane-bound lytic murein transglycosylase D
LSKNFYFTLTLMGWMLLLKAQPAASPASTPSPRGFNNLFETTKVGGVTGTKLNPMAISFVESYMARYGNSLRRMKEWGLPYFSMMDKILVEKGLPAELKYLAVIESGLKSTAFSWAGAVGPWQFMPATGRRYGLKVSYQVDERMDYMKSTQAAARYLKVLYTEFQDWLLVIAAYNGGEGAVRKAIRLSHSRNFWELQYRLPNESMNHVKKFIATHYVFEGEGGITTLTKEESLAQADQLKQKISEQELRETVSELIHGRYKKEVILKYTSVDPAEFRRFNPGFDDTMATKGEYTLRLSAACMQAFKENKTLILEESLQLLFKRNSLSQ